MRVRATNLLIIDSLIPEAASVGNDIAHGLDTKQVGFKFFFRFPKVKNTQGKKQLAIFNVGWVIS
jgi:hypothetical protein